MDRTVCKRRRKARKANTLVSILLIIVFVGTSGCSFKFSQSPSSPIKIISATPNKTTFGSGEQITIALTIKASNTFENVTVNVSGMRNTIGQLKLQKITVVALVKGVNTFNVTDRMPSCSSCSKLTPGMYVRGINITVSSFDQKIVARDSFDITLI